jgi:hypothetical protein
MGAPRRCRRGASDQQSQLRQVQGEQLQPLFLQAQLAGCRVTGVLVAGVVMVIFLLLPSWRIGS